MVVGVVSAAAARRNAARRFTWARRPGDCQEPSDRSSGDASCPSTYSMVVGSRETGGDKAAGGRTRARLE